MSPRKLIDTTRRSSPTDKGVDSFLVEETKNMERRRRLVEQQGERRLARVNAREHASDEMRHSGPEEDMQDAPLPHAYLDSQRFDGTEVDPEPSLNSAARADFDNQRREQQQEKQLRLGIAPKMGTAPKPQRY